MPTATKTRPTEEELRELIRGTPSITDSQIREQYYISKKRIKQVRATLVNPPAKLCLEDMTDLVIENFTRAKQVPAMEEEINRLRNQLAAVRHQLESIKQELQKRHDQETRWKLAVQQGEIEPLERSTIG